MATTFLIVKDNDEREIDIKVWPKYQAKGYRKVEEVMAEREAAKKAPAAKTTAPTKAELTAKAKELGIEVPKNATVAQIQELIAKAEAAPATDESTGDAE